ncbi:archaeosine tRNA-ribosyltransferase [Methanobrevibacter sp. OttesenSCG-928-K11]|nr:archaeosine tRNA-ribosyltransferase [Methanobrevibacter sp. OttesenSCG-928-K11]MDL2271200.1 archaeosine tRNA-ribosyltransferase [Methanobrevibacter sp. OttesenSCG-928-I08]
MKDLIKIKFEIKSHDGPGRLGKIENKETPILLNKKDYKIAPNEGSSYNIQREIAEKNVKNTISKSKKAIESENPCEIAVIQGSKYIDLRIECLKELEKLGYNAFIIANGDDLLLHPRELVEMIVSLRENISPNNLLLFTFAEPSFIPFLSYLGIDGFFNDSADYYSYLNVLMTPTKSYDLNEYGLYDNMSREEIAIYNENTLDLVLREVRAHMKNRSLRNLVEERAASNPQNMTALRILDKNYQEYLLKNTHLY